MNEHPNEIDVPTDFELTEPPRSRARAPRTLTALVGVAAVLAIVAVRRMTRRQHDSVLFR